MEVPDEICARHEAGRGQFLHSFSCDMRLDKSVFKKILGYDITTPGFARDALTRLEILGCSRAREYYEAVRSEWQKEHDAQMNGVARWYRKQCENEWENMKRKAVRESRKELEEMSNSELLTYLESLIAGA